jgi:hypothetical protein
VLGYALVGAALTELLLAGRLRHEHGQVVVATASPPVADPATAQRARAAIGEVLLGRQEPDEHAAALVALVQVSGLLDACVPDAERSRARRRARQIAAGNEVGQAVKRIQEEVMAAVTAAVVASSATAHGGGNASS